MPPAVTLDDVAKSFGDVVAVDGVSLEIPDGEFFSMLGPSGSGKTTCLRMIAGFEIPTRGSVLLHGSDVTGVPPYERDVNTVFQDYALFPHMTVAENVAYGPMVRKEPDQEGRAARALAMVHLDGFAAASQVNCPVDRDSGSPWRGLSSTDPRCSCSTNRWELSTSSFGRRCSWNSRLCNARWGSHSSM